MLIFQSEHSDLLSAPKASGHAEAEVKLWKKVAECTYRSVSRSRPLLFIAKKFRGLQQVASGSCVHTVSEYLAKYYPWITGSKSCRNFKKRLLKIKTASNRSSFEIDRQNPKTVRWEPDQPLPKRQTAFFSQSHTSLPAYYWGTF